MSETPTTPQEEQAFDQYADESLTLATQPTIRDHFDDDLFLRAAAERSQATVDVPLTPAASSAPDASKANKVLRNVVIGGVIATATSSLAYGAASTATDIFIEDQNKQVEENKKLAQEQIDFDRQLENGKVFIDQTENDK